MALRFMEYDKEELTVRLVKTGLMSQMALKELLDKAEEKGMSILKSYILQCLNDSKNPKQNFYIWENEQAWFACSFFVFSPILHFCSRRKKKSANFYVF